ncbi:MAG: PqqD family protein [Acidobacteriota bacterium]
MFPGATAPKAKAGLDISAAEDGFIVFQPEVERVHYLNHSAVLVLELCTGRNSARDIATLVQEAYSLPSPPYQAVEETVASLGAQGLLESL